MRRLLDTVETYLRRYPWVIPLLALVPCAWFAARGTNDLVAARLFAADTEALARPLPGVAAPAEAASADHHLRNATAIVHRNIFDSDAGCLDCAPPDAGDPDAAASAEAVADVDNQPLVAPEVCYRPEARGTGRVYPQPCDTQAKLVGAVGVSDEGRCWEPDVVARCMSGTSASNSPIQGYTEALRRADPCCWSFILVQSAANQPAMPFRRGSTLEGRTVGMVSWCPELGSYALLRPSGGQRCFLAQNMPPREAAPAAPAPAPVAAAPAAAGSGLNGVLEGIERVGPTEFNVRRSTVDRILESQAELMRTTRIMPHEQGGRVVGVQLFGVRGNSLLGRLGMQNGDVLNRINGLDIASPDRALEAYSRLRTSDNLQVSLTRNGQPVNIDFHIR